MRARQIATVAAVLGLTVAGFFGARFLGEREARRDSEHRAAVAAAQIRGRIQQGSSLAESLRRSLVSVAGTGVTSGEFESNASRWLSPAGFPAAAWVEQVPASERAAYERRVGHPIVTRDQRLRIVPVGSRSSYLPATLVSGIPPMSVPGIDLGDESGMASAMTPASAPPEARATPLATLRDGTNGLLLVRFAPRLTGDVTTPGFVVLFVSEHSLRAAAADTEPLQLTVGGTSTGHLAGGGAVHNTFTEAGQRFDVAVRQEPVPGAAAVLPWIILAAGLVLAALAGTLGSNAARRARAQDELDRFFKLSSDLIAVADLEGHFTRVNPAVEQILHYTAEEFLGRPYFEFLHPDDLERAATEMARIRQGKPVTIEVRNVRKDGSYRALEWTATPVLEEGFVYGVARDVTERRQAESELRRLADEQAALRRVATLVASGAEPAEVFSAVAEEVRGVLGADATIMVRTDPDDQATIVGRAGGLPDWMPLGTRWNLEETHALAAAVRTGRPARRDDYTHASGTPAEMMRQGGMQSGVATPIVVDGRLWGALATVSTGTLPADTEARMMDFTELIGTAIANTESRAQLIASRARVVAAADEARRRIERDLHDGTQQQLVALALQLRGAEAEVPVELTNLKAALGQIAAGLARATEDLQTMSRGIHPAVLSRGGIGPALKTLARRAGVPVELDVSCPARLPERAEVAAYYVVSEGLSNAAKHACASKVRVELKVEDAVVEVSIRDDGVGGADPDRGSGLIGLRDRVEALGGTLETTSPPGQGTRLLARIPSRRSDLGSHAQSRPGERLVEVLAAEPSAGTAEPRPGMRD